MSNSRSFQVKFFTRDEEIAIPSHQYEIKASMTCEELGKLVNAVLDEGSKSDGPLLLDFLILDQLLRTTIEEHLNEVAERTGEVVTVEKELTIEYIRKQAAPEAFNSLLNDDWVSCVQGGEIVVINGCYDGVINVWSLDGKHLLSIPAHGSAVKDIHLVDKQSLTELDCSWSEDDVAFVSVSHDQNCILWKLNFSSKEVDCLSAYQGHHRSVDCIDVRSDLFATGSFDNLVKIWSFSPKGSSKANEEERASTSYKKQKKEAREKIALTADCRLNTAVVTLSGHSEAVTDVAWMDQGSEDMSVADVLSCSMDNTIRQWDVELGSSKATLTGSKAFLSMDYSLLNRLIITGSCDRHIRLWDPRSQEGSLVKSVFSNHQGWVSDVAWSTTQENLFLSGAYDNCAKLWDIRLPKAPLFDLIGHENKVLAVDWSNPRFMVSGGADNHVKIFESKNGTSI